MMNTPSISETISQFKRKELTVEEHTAKVLEEAQKLNKEYFYYNTISEELALEQARALDKKAAKHGINEKYEKLFGIPLAVKDSICVKGVESSAGSRILKGYFPLFNATVVQRATDQGCVVIGKTAQDEFGFGAFSVNVGLGFAIPRNPFDKQRTTGGSSGGGVGISQKTKYAYASFVESTGGSIVEPSSFCSVAGICPTYGRLSRYGLIDFANSLDKIGAASKTIHDAALLLEAAAGHDPKDSTSSTSPVPQYTSFVGKPIKGMRIGIIKEAFGEGVDKGVASAVRHGIDKLEQQGIQCDEISVNVPIKYGIPTYYLLATSEASTNLAKYCGMRYGAGEQLEGNFNKYFTKVRSAHVSEEVKRRIMLGTFARMAGFRDAYYLKAVKVREKMLQEYKHLFQKYDALISPTVAIQPPTFAEIEKLTPLQHYMMDMLCVGPNITGLPHMNVPLPFVKDLPVGMMLIGDHFQESKLIQLGSAVEQDTLKAQQRE